MSIRPPSFLVLLCCLSLIGCGGPKFGKVSGKVTYQGKPLPGGKVMFWPQAAGVNPVSVPLQPDGSYTAEAVPAGEVSVTVETASVSGKPQGFAGQMAMGQPGGTPQHGGPPPEVVKEIGDRMRKTGMIPAQPERGNYVEIDPKYSRPDQSGFKTTVEPGEQTYNIDLK
jgi:hypothetical protein